MSISLPTITTILSSDLVKNSRTDINNNFSALNIAATETSAGLIELATLAEALSGTDNERAITAEGLNAYVAAATSAFLSTATGGTVSGNTTFTENVYVSGDLNVAGVISGYFKYLYAGSLSAPQYADNGSGNITVSALDVVLFNNSSQEGNPFSYSLSATPLVLTDETTNYIIADYNSGSPILSVTSAINYIDNSSIIPIFTIFRSGADLHSQTWDALGSGLANKLQRSIVRTERYRRQSGLELSEYGTRNINITSGIVWVGAVSVDVAAISSAISGLTYFQRTSGTWVKSSETQYNNTEYSDGSDTITLSTGKYAVNWVYSGIENYLGNHAYFVLGNGDYDLDDAQASQPPSGLPTEITSHCLLIGRIIVAKSASTSTIIDSAFDTVFPFQHTLSIAANAEDLLSLSPAAALSLDTQTQNTVFAGSNGGGDATPAFRPLVEADLSLANNTTNNASTTRHGFMPILSNDSTQFYNGQGNFAVPAGVVNSYTSQSYNGVTSAQVIHNFGQYPIVQTIDSNGAMLVPSGVVHDSLNSFTVTFSTSSSGTIIASVGSPQPQSLITVTGNYTALTTDRIITVTGGGSTISLFSISGNSGRELIIDNASSIDIYVEPISGQTIQGETIQTIPTQSCMSIYASSNEWRIY